MNMVKTFAGILTFIGILLLVYGCFAFLNGGGRLFGVAIDKWGTLAPFVLGIIFFIAGLSLMKSMAKK